MGTQLHPGEHPTVVVRLVRSSESLSQSRTRRLVADGGSESQSDNFSVYRESPCDKDQGFALDGRATLSARCKYYARAGQ